MVGASNLKEGKKNMKGKEKKQVRKEKREMPKTRGKILSFYVKFDALDFTGLSLYCCSQPSRLAKVP